MIDLSDLCDDPDFAQPLMIVRRVETVGSNGVATGTPTTVSPAPMGSVQSGANPDLLRGTDLATADNLITVYTKFRLRMEGSTTNYSGSTDAYGNPVPGVGSQTFQADIVYYNGDPYQVIALQDWAAYGAGFVAAICKQVNSGQAAL